jgi:3-deoxy-7-phosphoheptulonate synthase
MEKMADLDRGQQAIVKALPQTSPAPPIIRSRPVLTPSVLAQQIPLSASAAERVQADRTTVSDILNNRDKRLCVVVGPCSIHDSEAALDYAHNLKRVADRLADKLFVIMRVYLEKPRTVIGWKGLLNDPFLDGSYQINRGLRLARQLLYDINRIGLACATEFLDTTLWQYYADLISWGAIGARTVESQVHRELASGLGMPIGMKNRTDGNIQVALDAIIAARSGHFFLSLGENGLPAVLETTGNPNCHLVLRGSRHGGPNYDAKSISTAVAMMQASDVTPIIVVDCSHANSGSDPENQIRVVDELIAQMRICPDHIRGVMLESHLVGGRQDAGGRPLANLTYGQSITDACLSFENTAEVLERLAEI